jgi:hypothetical protein
LYISARAQCLGVIPFAVVLCPFAVGIQRLIQQVAYEKVVILAVIARIHRGGF